jgi:predicted membrane channel-forming protein YqfA (hemolysin III family)
MMRRGSSLFFALYLVLGLYFLNFGIQFIPKLTTLAPGINKWIVFFGGILLILGGINFLRLKKYAYRSVR